MVTSPPRAPVLWGVVEEHLDEASFLAGQWGCALVSPLYGVAELARGFEARLFANLEGLRLAGPAAAERLLAPALASPEPERILAAALALLEAPGREGLGLVVERLRGAEPEEAGPLLRALELARREGIERELLQVARAEQGAVAGAALRALAFRRAPIADELLAGWITAADPAILPAALHAARAASPRLWPLLERHLGSPEPAVRDAALSAGLSLGLRAAYACSRRAVESHAPGAELALLVLGSSGDASDVGRIAGALQADSLRGAALRALGLTGRRAAAEACLPYLADEELGPVAAEAISAVTGLAIAGEYERPAPEEPAEEAEEDDLDADLSWSPEADLPRPDAGAVTAWWSSARERLDPARRLLDGQPWSPERLLEAFLAGSLRRRQGLGLELRLRSHGAYAVEAEGWARDQLRAQAAAQLVVRSELSQPLERLLRE